MLRDYQAEHATRPLFLKGASTVAAKESNLPLQVPGTHAAREFVIGPSVKVSTEQRFAHAAPLLKEKGTPAPTLVSNR